MVSSIGDKLDGLLNAFPTQNSVQIPLQWVVDALRSIVDQEGNHIVRKPLWKEVKAVQLLIGDPQVTTEQKEIFRSLVLEKVKKIQEIFFSSAIPPFPNDKNVNIKIRDALIKIWKKELKAIDERKADLDLFIPLQARKEINGIQEFPALDALISFSTHETAKSCLLMGNTGGGKTTLVYFLARKLWEAHVNGFDPNKPIPIIIPLLGIGEVRKNILSEHFKRMNFDNDDFVLLQNHVNVLFIFEGYDERRVFDNLFLTNDDLNGWKNCKFITTCRDQTLFTRKEGYRHLFTINNSLTELFLCPFNKTQIQKYISEYAKQKQIENWNEEKYWELMNSMPSIFEIVSTPFALNIALQTLPKQQWSDDYEKKALSQSQLYKDFIDNRLIDEINKWSRRDGKMIKKENLQLFYQKIAQEMVVKGVTKIPKTFLFESELLSGEDKASIFLESGSLLKPVDDENCSFIHDSFRDHFASEEITHKIISTSCFAFDHPLNKNLILDEPETIKRIVEQLRNDPKLIDLLFEFVKASKISPLAAIGASNAMTLINRAEVSFLDKPKDFYRGIRIPGADLSGAILDGLDFTDSDWTNVKVHHTSMAGVNLTGCIIDGVDFGQLPILKFPNPVLSCVFSSNSEILAVGDSIGNVYLINTNDWEIPSFSLKNWFAYELNSNPIFTLSFSNNSQFLAVGARDGYIRIWDVQKRSLVKTLPGDGEPVFSILFNPIDDESLAVGTPKSIRLWDLKTKSVVILQEEIPDWKYDRFYKKEEELKQWGYKKSGYESDSDWDEKIDLNPTNIIPLSSDIFSSWQWNCPISLSFTSDGEKLASAKVSHKICIWDVKKKKILKTLNDPSDNKQVVSSINFGSHNKTLSLGLKNMIQVWDFENGSILNTIEVDTHSVHKVVFGSNGNFIFTGIGDPSVKVMNMNSSTNPLSLEGHVGNITNISVNTRDNIIASGSQDCSVRLWKSNNEHLISSKKIIPDFSSMAFNFDNRIVAIKTESENICLYDFQTGTNQVQISTQYSKSILFSQYRNRMIYQTENEWIVFDIKTKQQFKINAGVFDKVLLFSNDGDAILCVSKNKLILFDLKTNKSTNLIAKHLKKYCEDCKYALNDNGAIMAVYTCIDNHIHLYDLTRVELIDCEKFHYYSGFALNSKGNIVAKIYNNELYLSKRGKSLGLDGFWLDKSTYFSEIIKIAIFSPDDNVIAVAGKEGLFSLWYLNTSELYTHKFKSTVETIQWNIRGDELIIKCQGGSVKRYNVPVDLKNKQPFLLWSSTGAEGLNAEQTNITMVTGLSKQNEKLLLQYGATGQISQKKLSKDISEARDRMEYVGESCESVFANQVKLAEQNWVMSIAHKKKKEHAFLIIEGVKNKKRVIFQLEVFIDEEREKSDVSKATFGYAYVQIKPITKEDAQKLANECIMRTEWFDESKKDQLFDIIKRDSEKMDLGYSQPGNNSAWSSFVPANTKIYGNCLTFLEKWLRELGYTFIDDPKKDWKTSLVDRTTTRLYFQNN